ncbi:potassium channel family protein [Promicromonospora sp. NPDC050880]|uniref:potassium channel family protein n=1 Tax=Promicromonospora sp. NPDC050880 TaxID=3364406 RepID=UPI00378E0DFB
MTVAAPRHDGGTGPRPAGVVLGLLRAAATSAVLVVLYYVLPLDRDSVLGSAVGLGVGLVVFAVAVYREVRAIVRSRAPAVRAIQALAWLVPFFLLLFASTYYMLGVQVPGAFSETLSRSDALYFTVVTFATVGFGDVVPRAEGVRLLVSGQVLLDLVILGLGVRVILEAVRRGRTTG